MERTLVAVNDMPVADVFTIPMDAETVEGRKISADAKRGLMHQAMAIAAAQEAARSRRKAPPWWP